MQDEEGLINHGQKNTIHHEPWRALHSNGLFAHGTGHREHCLQSLGTRFFTHDDLKKGHERRRIKEMNSNKTFGPRV